MIDVVREDENGRVEASFPDPAIVADASLHDAAIGQSSRCLGFLDSYGDTTFNSRQIPVLAEELTVSRNQVTDPILRARLDALIAFVRSGLEERHTYIKFVGD
jgi:hypothetical protein